MRRFKTKREATIFAIMRAVNEGVISVIIAPNERRVMFVGLRPSGAVAMVNVRKDTDVQECGGESWVVAE